MIDQMQNVIDEIENSVITKLKRGWDIIPSIIASK